MYTNTLQPACLKNCFNKAYLCFQQEQNVVVCPEAQPSQMQTNHLYSQNSDYWKYHTQKEHPAMFKSITASVVLISVFCIKTTGILDEMKINLHY